MELRYNINGYTIEVEADYRDVEQQVEEILISCYHLDENGAKNTIDMMREINAYEKFLDYHEQDIINELRTNYKYEEQSQQIYKENQEEERMLCNLRFQSGD